MAVVAASDLIGGKYESRIALSSQGQRFAIRALLKSECAKTSSYDSSQEFQGTEGQPTPIIVCWRVVDGSTRRLAFKYTRGLLPRLRSKC